MLTKFANAMLTVHLVENVRTLTNEGLVVDVAVPMINAVEEVHAMVTRGVSLLPLVILN